MKPCDSDGSIPVGDEQLLDEAEDENLDVHVKRVLDSFGIQGQDNYDIAQKAVAKSLGVPEHCRAGVITWVLVGVVPGGFLKAVICNDLFEAFGRADLENSKSMESYVTYFYNHTPSQCWGSKEALESWAKLGGLKGMINRHLACSQSHTPPTKP